MYNVYIIGAYFIGRGERIGADRCERGDLFRRRKGEAQFLWLDGVTKQPISPKFALNELCQRQRAR